MLHFDTMLSYHNYITVTVHFSALS